MVDGLTVNKALSSVAAGKLTPRAIRSRRAVALLIGATSLLSLHLFRLAQLQIVQGNYHRQLADHNHIRPIPIVSDRGNILDRQGKVLAANQLSRSVYLYPREQTPAGWKASAPRLGEIFGVEPDKILAQLEKTGYRSAKPFRLVRNIKEEAFTAWAENGYIPGVEIQPESNRVYPYKNLGAHILGYIGEATEEQLKQNPEMPMGMTVGQMGLERMADDNLRGTWGSRLIEVDARGQELRMLGTQKPVSGRELQTTLDLRLQQAAEKGLAGRRGAVVVLDVKTGGIIAMASGPTFDPNMFTRRITQKDVDQVFNNPDKPFLNRALQGYPPASTFKIVSSVAGLQSGKYTPSSTIMTAGAIVVGGVAFHEHGSGGYGAIGFQEALTVSSNTFFYQVGMKVGPEEINKWGHKLGIGETRTALDGESMGLIPTPETKNQFSDEPWYAGDTVTMAIGQGMVTVTPMEMAVMISAIANGGKRVKPHFTFEQAQKPEMQPEEIGLSPSTLKTIQDGLIAVVKEGTARSLSDGSIPPTAGKTGTAEVPGGEDNSMYVGYGPVKDPQIAVAIVIERGGFGAEAAVPIAHEVYRAYFNQNKKSKPPSGVQANEPSEDSIAQRPGE
jgi:penicillin-binding protein 2